MQKEQVPVVVNNTWQELYQSALLELRPQELHRRIAVAEKAIQERMEELPRGDSTFEEERLALEDGIRSLRVLATLEHNALFKPSTLTQSKVTL